jgi:hypothetical protein
MEQLFENDNDGRRSGIERRAISIDMQWEDPERRTNEERRMGVERRLQLRLASHSLKNLNTIKFETPSKISKFKK